jgi:hypothetical protein
MATMAFVICQARQIVIDPHTGNDPLTYADEQRDVLDKLENMVDGGHGWLTDLPYNMPHWTHILHTDEGDVYLIVGINLQTKDL